MLSDLRFACRALLKTPSFTLVAVLTLAVAIGACVALYSVLQAVVLRPLPYPEPDRLVGIWAIDRERNLEAPAVSWAKYELFRERRDVFAAMSVSAGNGFTLTDGVGDPQQVFGLLASANFLPILGVQPVRGRQFTAEEDKEGGPSVAMISHQLWQSRFGGDPGLVGRVIQIDGAAHEVVAVLPPNMPLPFNQVGVIVPRPRETPFLTPQQRTYAVVFQAIGRLAPGVTLKQANLRVAEAAQQFRGAHAGQLDANHQNELRTLHQQVLGNLDRTFWALAGAVVAVLLIACANIINLFLARVSARQREIAVRVSLGAGRTDIVRQFLTESLAFSLGAGGLGILVAWWSLQGIVTLAGPQLPRANQIAIDPGVLAFTLGASVVSALLVGLFPAWQASRTNVQIVLKDTGRGATGGATTRKFQHALVIVQVALSLILLICAGLLVRSFFRLVQTEPGFATEGRAYGFVNLPAKKYSTPELTREFYRRLHERIAATPQLAAGGVTTGLPLSPTGFISPYGVQGRPVPPVQERPLAGVRIVSPGYFAAMGLRLRDGRFFAEADRFGAENVCLLNETLARKLFPGESALGKAILTGPAADTVVRIVGVVRDVKANGLGAPVPDEIYFPRDQRGGAFMVLVGQARTGLAASAVIPILRHLLTDLDPNLALANPQTVPDLLKDSLGVQRVTLALLLVFAGLAALLAAVGIYSVMAYTITQRTSEIGVRMALGAGTREILALVLRLGAVQLGAGLGLGLAGALAGTRLLRQALFEVQPLDPLVFAVVPLVFTAVGVAACLIPARRAARVDPVIALRAE